MKDLEEELKGFGIKFEGWREAVQKVGTWFRRVEDRAGVSSCGNSPRMRRRQLQSDISRLQPRL